MHYPLTGLSVLALLASAFARSNLPQAPLAPPTEHIDYDIPTIHESAVQARRIVQLAAHGELVTTFPTSGYAEDDVNAEYLPDSLAGSPIGLIEYIADCESGTGNPTLLAIDIATPYRNYRAGSNISLAIRWWPVEQNYYAADTWWSRITGVKKQDIPTPRTPVALPRLSLHGRIEPIDKIGFEYFKLAQCFIRKHPDSVYWQPQGGAHQSHYARFIVEEVYWLGGFGDRARIGWLPIDEWHSVTQREIDECRLPGEE